MTTTPEPTTSAELLQRIDREWRPLRARLAAVEPGAYDQPITIPWRPVAFGGPLPLREAVGIVAFWVETAAPAIAWMRGEPELPWDAWYGGAERWDGWPRDAVHHEREAARARARPPAEVLGRLDAAHARATAAAATLSEAEIREEHDFGEFGRMRILGKIRSCVYASYASLAGALAAGVTPGAAGSSGSAGRGTGRSRP